MHRGRLLRLFRDQCSHGRLRIIAHWSRERGNPVEEILALLLLEKGHEGKVYELNGPEALGRSDIAEIVTHATGRQTTALPISGDEFGEFMREQGRPPFVVEMVKGLHAAIDAGEFARVWPDAAQLLKRPAQSPREYLRKAFERT